MQLSQQKETTVKRVLNEIRLIGAKPRRIGCEITVRQAAWVSHQNVQLFSVRIVQLLHTCYLSFRLHGVQSPTKQPAVCD